MLCFFHFIMDDLSVRNVILFTKLVFFSRLKFAVLNYNIMLEVYFKYFLFKQLSKTRF